MRKVEEITIGYIEDYYEEVYERLACQLSVAVSETLAKCKDENLDSCEIKIDERFAQDLSDYLISYWFFDGRNELIEDIIKNRTVQEVFNDEGDWQIKYSGNYCHSNKGIGWWYEVSFRLIKREG